MNIFGCFLSAVQIFPENVKAYYRKLVALKAQKKYKDALKVAEVGLAKQPSVSKISFILTLFI